MVNVGYYNFVASNRIVCILSPHSKPSRNLIRAARIDGRIVDLTMGKRTRSILIMDTDHVVLSANATKTIAERINDLPNKRR